MDSKSKRDVISFKPLLKTILSLISAIISKKNLDDILKNILLHCLKVFKTKHGCIMLLEPSKKDFIIRVGTGDYKKLVGNKCSNDFFKTEKLKTSFKPVIINGHCKWDSKNKTIVHNKSGKMISVPVKTETELIGIILIICPNLKRNLNLDKLRVINVFSSLVTITLDNARLFNFIFEEYNELLRVEKELRQSEEKFYQLFYDNPTMMVLFSLKDKRIVDVNKSLLKKIKYSKSEMINKRIEDFAGISNDLRNHVISFLNNKTNFQNFEIKFFDKNGDEIIGLLSGQILKIQNEECMLFLITDITEVTMLRDELEKSRALESLGILSGGIAHNFNNLMQSLLGNISLAKYYSNPNEKVYKILDRAEKSYKKAKELTEQMLIFAKGGLFTISNINLHSLFKRVLNEIIIPENILLVIDIDDYEKVITGDENQLKICFKNIIQNAIESINGKGKIEIKVESVKQKVLSEKLKAKDNFVIITIKDNGCGIKKENLRKIFNPFYTTKENNNNKGLGLSISQSIVNKHKGKIKIESEEGVGTTVKVQLPILL